MINGTNPCSKYLMIFLIILLCTTGEFAQSKDKGLVLGKAGYFEMPGLNVLVYNNTFPEGHQGGVEIIQHGNRVATNGELRLNPTPGQWQPIPKLGEGYEARGVSPQGTGLASRIIDSVNNEISMPASYPDESRSRKGFNPILYPDLQLKYTVHVKAKGSAFTITVDLDKPVPAEWVGRVGYILELFPGDLYGKTYFMDGKSGVFPRQPEGPSYISVEKEVEPSPFAEGNKLVVAPESDLLRMVIESSTNKLELLDGSLKHNNGWFTVRSIVPAGATKGAIQWTITPNVIPNWVDKPVVHVSQVGYHPNQNKIAFIELDKNDKSVQNAGLYKLEIDGKLTKIKEQKPERWGKYLRYEYYELNFSDVKDEGSYLVKYGDVQTNIFRISKDIYKHNVWQPTLEYFLPVQMCHMRINQKYRVWHGACHMDDALMAPLNVHHFDGYANDKETSTLCQYKPMEHVPGLNVGGWHDAGDYDLRIESQAQTVLALVDIYEEFGINYDETYVNQKDHFVEIHQPDGKPDILQQVEHGVLTILGSYRNMGGMLYRGILDPTLRQYVHLGDASTHTDGKVFDNKEEAAKANKYDELWYTKVANRYSNIFDPEGFREQVQLVAPDLDDRFVWTESNPAWQLNGSAALAAASRVLKNYDANLAKECLAASEDLWQKNKDKKGQNDDFQFYSLDGQKIETLVQLILATEKQEYKDALCKLSSVVKRSFVNNAPSLGKVLNHIDCQAFKDSVNDAAVALKPLYDQYLGQSPYHSTLANAEFIAYACYYLNKYWPKIYPSEGLFSIINYMLGCKPGNSTNSLVSGVGVNSPTVAYGANRADWSYIPGGTFWNAVNLVNPDLAEDKIWPYMWQEREYIITSPCYYMFSVLGADRILEGK